MHGGALRVAPDERPLADSRPFLILAGLAAIAIGGLIAAMLRHPGMPAIIADDYMRVAGGLIELERETSVPSDLSSALAIADPGLMVPDLGDERYRLAGGTRLTRAGQPAVLAVYHNPRRDLLVYHAWRGEFEHMPATGDVRERAGRTFHVHQKSTSTLVFWREGGVVRVVTSSLPTEQVVSLAVAAAAGATGA